MREERNPGALELGASALASDRSRGKALIFLAAGLSFLGSISLWFSGAREEGLFVGLWVPSILSAGTLLLSGHDHE